MKKMFLLITIILITFGFSLNSNVIIDYFNRNNNAEQVNVEESNSNVVYSTTQPIIVGEVKTTPTTATVHYEINDSVSEIKKIEWKVVFIDEEPTDSSNDTIETHEIDKKEEQSVDGDGIFSYEGDITAEGLTPGTEYFLSYLTATNESDINYLSTYFTFDTPAIIEEGIVEKTSIIPSSTSAEVWYTITPTTYEDKTKEVVNAEPLTIKWVDKKGNTLAEEQDVNGNYNGSIVTTAILEPNTRYLGTKLVVTDEFNLEYSSSKFSFKTEPDPDVVTTIVNDGKATNVGRTEATIKYIIEPGSDETGELEIEQVSWKDNNDELLEGAIINNDKRKISETGTLTATNLTPSVTYSGTYLEVLMSNDVPYNSKSTPIADFTMISDDSPGIVNVPSENISTTETSATINYVVTPASEPTGEPINPETITWDNGKGNSISEDVEDGNSGWMTMKGLSPNETYSKNKLTVTDETGNDYETDEYFSVTTKPADEIGEISIDEFDYDQKTATAEYTIETANNKDGIELEPISLTWMNGEDDLATQTEFNYLDKEQGIIDDEITAENLIPGTEYNNTKLVVKDESGVNYCVIIEPFTTKSADEPGEVIANEVTNTTENSVTIHYIITPRYNDQGVEIEPTKLSWIDKDNDDKVIGDETATITGPGYDGTITANGLIAGTEYENTYLKVDDYDKYNDKNESYQNDVDLTIKTESAATPGSVSQTGKVKTTSTTATINYKIVPATKDNGEKIVPSKIFWIDDDSSHDNKKPLQTKIIDTEDDYSGELVAEGLPSDTTYNQTKLKVENKDGTSLTEYSVGEFKTDLVSTIGKITTTTDRVSDLNENTAIIGYQLVPAQTNGQILEPTKITWVDEKNDPIGDGGKIVGHESDNIIPQEGEIKVSELTPYSSYDGTYLRVNDKSDVEYTSKDGEEDSIKNFNTLSAKYIGDVWGEIDETKNDFAILNYYIDPAIDHYGNELPPTKITWFDKNGNVLAIDKPEVKDEDGLYVGQLIANDLPKNTPYEDTTLLVKYDKPDKDDGDKLTGSIETTKEEEIDFNSGNYKSRNMIMGGSILGVIVVILLIIFFFIFRWWKKRRVV